MATPLIRFSCVVDHGPVFPKQALRWARSLIEIAGVPAENLVVHYTEEAGPDAVAPLAKLGVTTIPVAAVSRRRQHLNKLAQLRSNCLQEADLAVLCDCDTVFVTDPRPYLAKGQIAAAVVDRPNPPIDRWETLLDRAGLSRQRPDITAGTMQAMTLFENRNGGLYVLPGNTLARLDPPWRKWADWLEGQLDVLGKRAIHIDQIAFALACLELGIAPELLPRALNFPTHLPLGTVGDDAPVILHYHRHVDGDGKLKPLGAPTVERAIAFVNERLAMPARLHRKRRLVLHVGLPKTATSALQRWCAANSGGLLEQGIRYPTPSRHTHMPKHQFIVMDLMSGNLARTATAVAEGDEESTILTSEGLTNHLYDFRPASLESIRGILDAFHVSVFLVHRQPDAWVKSYHMQCEINPRNIEYHYGTGLDLTDFQRLSRVHRLLDIRSLTGDCAAAFGAKEVVAESYESDWLNSFFALCGYAPGEQIDLPRTNESVPDWVFAAVLRINRQSLSDNARVAWLATLQRFTNSRHAGLIKHEATAAARNLWRELDPSLADAIATADPSWSGYRDLIENLRAH